MENYSVISFQLHMTFEELHRLHSIYESQQQNDYIKKTHHSESLYLKIRA